MKTHDLIPVGVGLHRFVAYEGDVEYVQNDEGIMVPANPVVFDSGITKNLILTTGKNLLLDRLFGLGGEAALTNIGVGDSSTAAAVGQTQLIGSNTLIQAATSGPTRSAQTVTIASTFGTGVANFTWNEAGLFNGTTNGTSKMFNRVVIGPFAKTSTVSIVYTATVTQS